MDIMTMKAGASSSAPYSNTHKSLKVKIVKIITNWTTYTRANGKKSKFLKFYAADPTGYIEGVAYDVDTQEKLIKEGSSAAFKNYLLKDGVLKLTTTTKIFRCEPVMIPDEVLQQIPQERKYTDVKQIQTSPCKALMSVKGIISKEEAVKTVDAGQRKTKVKELTVQDSTGEVKLALWDNMAEKEVKCGNNVHVIDAVVKFSSFHGENILSLNSLSGIDIVPEECMEMDACSIIGIHIEHEKIHLIVTKAGDEMELACSHSVMAKYCNLDENEKILEDTITSLLPIQCCLTVSGGNIKKIQ